MSIKTRKLKNIEILVFASSRTHHVLTLMHMLSQSLIDATEICDKNVTCFANVDC